MAGCISYRSFIWALLFMMMLAAPVWAGESEEPCEAPKEKDHKGECCAADMMTEEYGEKTCFEIPSDMSVAVAFTLIGSFTFLISLQFMMNHNDADMRKYAYKVISSTVSIFTAVLMFQCLNGLVEDWIIDRFELEHWYEFAVDAVHFMFWYIVLQLVVATASGALKSEEWRSRILDRTVAVNEDKNPEEEEEQEKELVQIKCGCYALVLAHLTGFASINCWAGMQEQAPFNSSPLMALVPLIPAFFWQLLLQRIADHIRERIAAGDGEKDYFEEQWDDACEDAENDVMGLTLSVLLVNSVRMLINGMAHGGGKCLPNQEQKEEGPECEELVEARQLPQCLYLLLAGVILVISLFCVKLVMEKFFPEEEEGEGEEKEDKEKPLLEGAERGEKEGEGEEEGEEKKKSLYAEVIERLVDVFMVTLAMGFSWCCFHANKQIITTLSPDFLGKEDNECTLAVVLALEVTYLAFIIIRILDKISDDDFGYTPDAVDEAIESVIDAMSLLIGFSWEQTFDISVDSLANSFREKGGEHAPALAKFCIGSCCCIIVGTAWRWYILPFVIKQGWNFRIVFTGRDLHLAAMDVEDDHVKHTVLPALEAKYDPQKSMFKDKDGKSLMATKSDGSDPYKKNQELMERLQESEKEKVKLQKLLNGHMESMLEQFKSMNEIVSRIEME